MSVNVKDKNVRHSTYLVIHRVHDLVPALAPAAGAYQPSLVFDDIAMGVPSADIHLLFGFAGDIQQLHSLVEVNGFSFHTLVESIVKRVIEDPALRPGIEDIVVSVRVLVFKRISRQVISLIRNLRFLGSDDYGKITAE